MAFGSPICSILYATAIFTVATVLSDYQSCWWCVGYVVQRWSWTKTRRVSFGFNIAIALATGAAICRVLMYNIWHIRQTAAAPIEC